MNYIFHRAEGFYPVSLPDEVAVFDNVACNPGTLKVTEAATNKVVFEAPATPQGKL